MAPNALHRAGQSACRGQGVLDEDEGRLPVGWLTFVFSQSAETGA